MMNKYVKTFERFETFENNKPLFEIAIFDSMEDEVEVIETTNDLYEAIKIAEGLTNDYYGVEILRYEGEGQTSDSIIWIVTKDDKKPEFNWLFKK